MKKLSFFLSYLFLCFSFSACAATEQPKTENQCNNGVVKFTAEFATGRMDECQVIGKNRFLITLKPENTPINSSPWYAFKVTASQPASIDIVMKVKGTKHRYPPKVSHNGHTWQLQKYRIKGDRLLMSLNVDKQATWIAAQEIINNQFYLDWQKSLAKTPGVEVSRLGYSTEDRAIYKIESFAKANKWLVLLGRQHPPEVTGALALFPFVETLLADTQLAKQFRQQYNILIIPNINPDGVAAGNWRHNADGVDLNRDWQAFKQRETRQIDQYLTKLTKAKQKIVFAIDFHSTREDIFYTMPSDYGVEKPYFVEHWLGALDKKMPNFKVVQKPGNNPNKGVSKQYFADKFHVHAITYEMADNAGRQHIKEVAINAADLLMQQMLSNSDYKKP